jgi:multidrug resistance efflux pump
MHPNPRKVAPIVLLLALIAGIAYGYFGGRAARADTGLLTASGTIEATQVTIVPEVGGRVVEVLVEEGDMVQAGQVLVRFDDALLQAQLKQAQASLVLAQANYDLVAAGPPDEQRQAAIAAAELELLNARQALDALYDNAEVNQAQAQQAVVAARKAVRDAERYLRNVRNPAEQIDIDQARANVAIARDRMEKAQEDYEPYAKKPEDNLVRAVLLSKKAQAEKVYEDAVRLLNNLLSGANDLDLAEAEAQLSLAQAQLALAQKQADELENGIDPDALAQAQARLRAAEANLAVARATPTPQQLAVARAQVQVAQAAIEVIQAQINKLVVTAPRAGVVLTRAVEPGEVVAPGSPLLTLADVDHLTLTVYIPEDRYGSVRLGQAVRVTVDSFPGETFQASVVRIADQAEYTPRNVQTESGRRTTVFAVKLALTNVEGKLKPGMPADVVFQ